MIGKTLRSLFGRPFARERYPKARVLPHSLFLFALIGAGFTFSCHRGEPLAAGSPPSPAPLACTVPVVDMGSILVPLASMRERSFRVENSGTETVVLNAPSTSCSCVKAEVTDRRILPGQATTVRLQIYPQAGSGEVGRKEFSAIISAQGHESTPLVLKVISEFRNDAVITPATVSFGQIARAALPVSQELRILERTISVVPQAQTDCPWLKVAAASEGVEITLSEVAPLGRLSGEVTVTLGSIRAHVPVSAEICGRFSILPTPIILTEREPRQRFALSCREAASPVPENDELKFEGVSEPLQLIGLGQARNSAQYELLWTGPFPETSKFVSVKVKDQTGSVEAIANVAIIGTSTR